MSVLFSNQDFGRPIYKHKKLPVFVTDEFVFYRCVSFNDSFYGKTVSELHMGNLRLNTPQNRYSKLFPNAKVSYWADSPETARAEVKYHNSGNNLLTFWAYDDATSIFPTLPDNEPLIIADGRDTEFANILDKVERDIELSDKEKELVNQIIEQKPDCLTYRSLRKKHGLNYLFFEKGFRKLAIREVRLRLGEAPGKNSNHIACAVTCDYSPCLNAHVQ